MKLTDFLISRQHGLSKNIVYKDQTIYLEDINSAFQIDDWNFCDANRFENFISKYAFPKNEEFSKKDRERIQQNIPRPQILIQKNCETSEGGSPIIAMYLYQKEHLTGDSLLHIRSINKLEQMWLPYFINVRLFKRGNPRVFRKDFYEYCQSGDIEFTYQFFDAPTIDSARLRIVTFGFKDHVLLAYAFDKMDNELTQEELNVFVNPIRATSQTIGL
jgi:hypothetical protein